MTKHNNYLTNVCYLLTNDYICIVNIKSMIMWMLALIIPFISLIVLGYLVYEAPEVSNDLSD
jgi:hypothetical protein